jgi:hypothetical protein
MGAGGIRLLDARDNVEVVAFPTTFSATEFHTLTTERTLAQSVAVADNKALLLQLGASDSRAGVSVCAIPETSPRLGRAALCKGHRGAIKIGGLQIKADKLVLERKLGRPLLQGCYRRILVGMQVVFVLRTRLKTAGKRTIGQAIIDQRRAA